MNRINFIQVLLAFWLLGGSLNNVFADGGVIRLRETQGPFVVTIFTTGELVRSRPVDVSVMVQSRDSSEPVLDAVVDLILTPPLASVAEHTEAICGVGGELSEGAMARPFNAPATRKQASNKLLYAAPIEFSAAGDWRLQVAVKRGNEAINVGCYVPVQSPPRRLAALFPYLAFPPLLVALFAINQGLRKQSDRKSGS